MMNLSDRPVLDGVLTAETFFGDVATTLAGTMEEVVGLENASHYVARVGCTLGADLADRYHVASDGPLPPAALGRLLVDLKQRIGGEFNLEEATESRLVLSACQCPFGSRVHGRPSLCMMTTTVFGTIAAEAQGYARVQVTEAIATGHGRCRVEVSLEKGPDDAIGHEFFR